MNKFQMSFEEWIEMSFQTNLKLYSLQWVARYGLDSWVKRHDQLVHDYADYCEQISDNK